MLNQQDLSCTDIGFPNGSEGIPDWFEYQSMEDTISFWFNKKIPTIRCIFLIRGTKFLPNIDLFLNGNYITLADFSFYYEDVNWSEHAFLFDLKLDECINKRFSNKPELYKAIKNNEWNHVEIKRDMCLSDTDKKEMKKGIHVSWYGYDFSDLEKDDFSYPEKKKSNKEGEVRFTNPYSRKRKLVEVGVSETEEDEDLSDTERDEIFTNPYRKKTKSDEYLNASLQQKELMKEEERNTWGTLLGLGASNSNTNGDEIEISSSAQMDEGVGDLIFADSSLPQKISKQDETKMWGTFLGLGAS